LPIQRWTDVAVPVETAYERWRNMEDFPRFMLRVLSVEQESDDTLSWQEKIWFSKRSWKARIIDERENERIAWEAMSGTGHSGVVSFHRIDENLTRVMVTLDFHPTNLIERVASGLRFVKRAVESDLARFKAYVELGLADESQQEGQDRRDEQAEGDDRRRVRGKPREARGQRRQTRRRRETA